ncbi:phosphatidylinositol:UDP-GlcNAc transferase PIG-C [Tirmania nivea]|nr:phosphatidylinositol:UDP-GlcNAc transferase PIG-C [Tirmania nivea]
MASTNGAHDQGSKLANGITSESVTPIPPGGHAESSKVYSRTGSRSRSTRQKPWRKLLWVKQNYPDNWVDSSFLNQLQRNVNVHPYDFWPLVAESTVITQHLSSVVIFITCFIAIFTERASPVVVAGGSSALTVLGYWIWDMGWEVREAVVSKRGRRNNNLRQGTSKNASRTNSPTRNTKRQSLDLHLQVPYGGSSPTPELHTPIPRYQHQLSLENGHQRLSSTASSSSKRTPNPSKQQNGKPKYPQGGKHSAAPSTAPPSRNSSLKSRGKGRHTRNNSSTLTEEQDLAYRRRQQRLRRLRTAKSAILIYCTLLGLSPILRSLTESISSDSIWAISSWLFIANCLSFDYGSGVSVKFPASLSTNAAIMASVVLASRLPTTTHVFSLVLFSIEVFGLFPVFRRYLRHISWYGHVALTVVLVGGAAVGLGMNVGWGWAWGWIGLMGPGIMGGCSWWLMWLQRYKNEIHGPWDPAKPIIRRQWEG